MTSPSELRGHRVVRARGGGYFVYSDRGRIGFAWTLWGAKSLIRKDKAGRGPGSVAYVEAE